MPTGNLPKSAKALWEKVYNASKSDGDSEETAAQKAWGAVKNAGWSKGEDGTWHKKALTEFSLTIKRASFDPQTKKMRWKADASDVDTDLYGDSMSLELYQDFISRIESKEPPPAEFRSQFWSGGMPYLSISHYPDLDGSAVPGMPTHVYIDGKFFKTKGVMYDSPLGRAAWDALKKDQELKRDDPVRISIAFLDYAHTHKSNGYQFERKSLKDECPECIKELMAGEYPQRIFTRGHLIHLALTRVPVNQRTLMEAEVEKSMTTRKEDAESIVGEMAEELEQQASLVGKSEALIVRADEEETPEVEVQPEEIEKATTTSDTALPADLAVVEMLNQLLIEIRDLKSSITRSEVSLEEKMKDKVKDDEEDMEEDDNMSEDEKKKKEQMKSNVDELVPSLVQALSEAFTPVTQRLDMLIAAQSNRSVAQPQATPTIAQRRSIAPATVPQGVEQQRSQGGPMKISDFVKKSVEG